MTDGIVCDIEAKVHSFGDESTIGGVKTDLVWLIPLFALAFSVILE